MPAAWTESTVEKVAPAACNPDTSQLERVLIADQARNTPAEFMDTPVQVYLISRYYCSDKDQHLNVVLMMARDWPNAAQVLPNGTPDGS